MAANAKFRLPGPSNRTTVIGRTGSGKSHFAAWLLSLQNFDEMPWIIVDFKDEHTDIINSIGRIQYLDFNSPLPERPGLYIIKPNTADKDELEQWLWKVFYHGYIGLYFDEVFPVGQHNEAFNTILMQGRSKHVPAIVCTQRPSNVSVYCFSEASFYFIFDLTKTSDRKRINEEISAIPRDYNLRDYHSYYYDVAKKNKLNVNPAPEADVILANIDAKIPVQKRTL